MKKLVLAGLAGVAMLLGGCAVHQTKAPVEEKLPPFTAETEHMVPLAKDAAWDKILLHVSEKFDVTLMSKESGIIKAQQKHTVPIGFDCIKSNPSSSGMVSPWIDTQLIITVDMNSAGNSTKATAKLTARTSRPLEVDFYTYGNCQSSGFIEHELWEAAK